MDYYGLFVNPSGMQHEINPIQTYIFEGTQEACFVNKYIVCPSVTPEETILSRNRSPNLSDL